MKLRFVHFFLLALLFCCTQCISDNAEEKYASAGPGEVPKGEIAWFPLNGNLNDSTGNYTPIAVAGPLNFVAGKIGSGLSLDGSENFIMMAPGYLDTLSILFWLKTPKGIANPNRPVIFDYGQGAVSAELVDGITSATDLSLNQNNFKKMFSGGKDVGYLNTYNAYSLIYIEAAGNFASFYFKGQLVNGTAMTTQGRFEFPSLMNATSELIYLGRSPLKGNNANSYFKGFIDEIHVFNRFLSQSELEYFKTIQSN
jgi:hypothetical protein